MGPFLILVFKGNLTNIIEHLCSVDSLQPIEKQLSGFDQLHWLIKYKDVIFMTLSIKDLINLIIIFSAYYMTTGLGFSFVYISIPLGILGLIFLSYRKRIIFYRSIIILPIILLFYYSITQIIIEADIGTLVNMMLSITTFITLIVYLPNINATDILKIAKRFINASIVLLIIEAIYRITNPSQDYLATLVLQGKEIDFFEGLFYAYKMNSFMFMDSNFVGLVIIVVYFLAFYLRKIFKEIYRYQLIVLSILALLTFSRAAIFSMILFWLIFRYMSSEQKSAIYYIRLVVVLLLAIFFIFIFLSYYQNDGSLISKFYILEQALLFEENATIWQMLFGIGFGNAVYFLNIGAHNFILTFLVESGIVGLVFLLLFWIHLLKNTNFAVGYIMLPFLTCGLSLTSHAVPYLYVAYAIIFILSNKAYLKKIETEKG